MNKSAADKYKLVDDLALNQSQWQNPREALQAIEGRAYEIDSNSKLVAEVAVIKRQIDQMSLKSVTPPPYSICGSLDHLAINYGVGNEIDYEQINIIN
jgi:hypothetical protein